MKKLLLSLMVVMCSVSCSFAQTFSNKLTSYDIAIYHVDACRKLLLTLSAITNNVVDICLWLDPPDGYRGIEIELLEIQAGYESTRQFYPRGYDIMDAFDSSYAADQIRVPTGTGSWKTVVSVISDTLAVVDSNWAASLTDELYTISRQRLLAQALTGTRTNELQAPGTGRATIYDGSNVVVGTGTKFLTQLRDSRRSGGIGNALRWAAVMELSSMQLVIENVADIADVTYGLYLQLPEPMVDIDSLTSGIVIKMPTTLAGSSAKDLSTVYNDINDALYRLDDLRTAVENARDFYRAARNVVDVDVLDAAVDVLMHATGAAPLNTALAHSLRMDVIDRLLRLQLNTRDFK